MDTKYAETAEARFSEEVGADGSLIDPKVEKSLLRRLDIVLLPTLGEKCYPTQEATDPNVLYVHRPRLPHAHARSSQSWKCEKRHAGERPRAPWKPIQCRPDPVLRDVLDLQHPGKYLGKTVQRSHRRPDSRDMLGRPGHGIGRGEGLWGPAGLPNGHGCDGSRILPMRYLLRVAVLQAEGVVGEVVGFLHDGVYCSK